MRSPDPAGRAGEHAGDADAQARIARLIAEVDDYLYSDELAPGGRRRTVLAGAGRQRLLGADATPVLDPLAEWQAAVHADDRQVWEEFLTAARDGRATAEYRLVGHDGATRWVWDRGTRRTTADGREYFDGVASDITESRQLHDELMTTIAEMNQLNGELLAAREEAERRSRVDALTGVFNRRHFGEVLARTLAESQTAERASLPGLILLDVDRFKHINDTYGHGVGDEVLTGVAARLHARIRREDCVARWGGEEFVILIPELTDDLTLRRIGEAVRVAISGEPLPTSAGPLAVTASFGAVRLTPELATPERLVDAADQALYSAKRRGRNQVRQYTELSEADLISEEPETVRVAQALALAVSIREGMPELHSQHVADLSVKVAEHVGASPAVVLRCRLGGWLHDVGKIAIPDFVLAKRGPLDPAEWQLMRQHSIVGEEMVRRVAGLAEAAAAVRHHHERYDGTGYPDRIAGEGIPLEARIIAVVDAYSAITADRVYQGARTRQQALQELQRCAGTHFDPHVVDAFAAVIEEESARIRRRLGARRDDEAEVA
jgi:diguanylate cyclase (GGDEF)-like protein